MTAVMLYPLRAGKPEYCVAVVGQATAHPSRTRFPCQAIVIAIRVW